MKKTLAVLLVVVMALSLCLTGCSKGEETSDQKIIFNIGGDPSSLDPLKASTTNEGVIDNQLFECLTRYGQNGEVVGGVAKDWTISEDGLTYTFNLRPEAKFSNGDELKASDVVYSYTRILDPRNGGTYAFQLYPIKGAEALNTIDPGAADADKKIEDAIKNLGLKAVDDHTVEITLERVVPYFLSLSTFFTYGIISEKVDRENPQWAEKAETFVSNGPFKMTEWSHNERLTLKKNENYWDKDVMKIEEIEFLFIESATTEITMFETGKLDVTYNIIPAADLKRLQENNTLKLHDIIMTRYISINVTHAPLDDVRVRKALSLAIDRQSFSDHIFQGTAIPMYAYVPYGMSDADETKDFREVGGDILTENVEEAQRLLAEAGYPNGEGFPGFELLYGTSEANKAMVEAYIEMWKQNLNITNIVASNVEGKVRTQRRLSGEFDMTIGGWTGDYLDPMTFMETLTTGNVQNDSRYSNPEYDALIEKASSTMDKEERYQALHQAEEILMNDLPLIPVTSEPKPYLQNDKLKGDIRNAMGLIDFKFAYKE